jgi:hypothetical protein
LWAINQASIVAQQGEKTICNVLRADAKTFDVTFHYNAHENKIEVTYSFTSTIPSYNGTVVVEPHAHTLGYGRKQKGLKPANDSIFDNPAKAAEITGRAQELFDHELGWAIARTVQELAHEANAMRIIRTLVRQRNEVITQIEYFVIRLLLLALLLIAAYRILDREIHLSGLISEFMWVK